MERPVGAISGKPASVGRPAQPTIGGETGVSLNREATDAGRALRGLPQAKEVLQREFGESAALTDKKEAQFPGYGSRLVDKFAKGAAAANDVEHAAVLNQLAKSQDEVVAHLTGLVGSDVKVTLEIDATIDCGAPEDVVRTVTENSKTLKFKRHGFEKE